MILLNVAVIILSGTGGLAEKLETAWKKKKAERKQAERAGARRSAAERAGAPELLAPR